MCASRRPAARLGFITPLTHNFCESCNRVRITCTGTLYMCLGQEDAADLRAPLRASEANDLLDAAIDEAIARKPKGHDFVIDRRHKRPAVVAPHERHRRLIRRRFSPAPTPWPLARPQTSAIDARATVGLRWPTGRARTGADQGGYRRTCVRAL